ncbi:MAG: lysozyme inhibitor LprI family protein [Gemmatimonadaceae bacterium]
MSDSLLPGLDSDYQVLTELYRAGGSVTYLARHLQLARDVTITAISAKADGGKVDLLQVEADTKRLIALRHPNIVPVLEGRWLDRQSFLVVRARVRGSTLDQLLSAIGAVPLLRVKSTLEQTHAALSFARANGIASRHIAPESLVFQQGSGRVLVGFDSPAGTSAARRPDGENEDTQTIGRLARVMLSGRLDADRDRTSLAELRPDLPTQIAGAADELVIGGKDADVLAFFSRLAVALGVPDVPAVVAPTTSSTPVTPAESVPAVRRATVARSTIGPPARVVTPMNIVTTSVPSSVRAVPPRRFGTGAQWAIGIGVVVALAAVGAFAVLQPHFLASYGVAAVPRADSATVATGDVAKRPATVSATVAPLRAVAPVDSARTDSSVASVAILPAATPPAGDTTPKPAQISAPPSNVTANAACSSTLPADQRKCFADAVQRADADLNRVYNALIIGLRRQAKSAPDDPDPPTAEKLRSAQRAWLDARDRACQVVGAGIFSGRDRGQCFADRAAKRSRDLQLSLDSVPPGTN